MGEIETCSCHKPAVGQVWISGDDPKESVTITAIEENGPFPIQFHWNNANQTKGAWEANMHGFYLSTCVQERKFP